MSYRQLSVEVIDNFQYSPVRMSNLNWSSIVNCVSCVQRLC